MAKPKPKEFYLIIGKHGKNRFSLKVLENNTIVSQHSYNDVITCELAKIVLESKGFKNAGTIRAA
jgi:predicted transcriptional regulator